MKYWKKLYYKIPHDLRTLLSDFFIYRDVLTFKERIEGILINIWYLITKPNRKLYYFIQRGTRGWADCDTWNLDAHLADVITGGVRYLKRHQNGMPLVGPDYRALTEKELYRFNEAKGKLSEKLEKEYLNRWNEVLDKIIKTFEMVKEVNSIEDLRWFEIHYEDKKLAKKKLAEYKDGWKLFREYFGSLWD